MAKRFTPTWRQTECTPENQNGLSANAESPDFLGCAIKKASGKPEARKELEGVIG